MVEHVDVAIIGGGPAGMQAMRLAGDQALERSGYEEALAQFERALSLEEDVPEELVPVLLEGKTNALDGMGRWTDVLDVGKGALELYDAMGDYPRAEPLLERSLKITENVLGPEHPSTATSANNLGNLYDAMGDYARAEPLHQRALKILEKTLGPEHPNTASSINNLGLLYQTMGDYERAEPLFQRALKIAERGFPPGHPSVATGLENLGILSLDLEKTLTAKRLAVRAQRAELVVLNNILSFTSERQRLAYQASGLGADPYLLKTTDLITYSGSDQIVKVRMQSNSSHAGGFSLDGSVGANWAVIPDGQWHEYEVELPASVVMAAVHRMSPSSGPGRFTIAWFKVIPKL